MWLLDIAFLVGVGCDHPVDPTYATPDSVTAMEGNWRLDANITFKVDTVAYMLDISDGAMVVGETTSRKWPYDLPATLNGTKLRCKRGNAVVWEVPVEGLPVHAGRAIAVLTLTFQTATPFDTLTFECSAGRFPEDKAGPDEWSGTVFLDDPSTAIAVDGVGSFTATRKR
jgi:hypothetical protein